MGITLMDVCVIRFMSLPFVIVATLTPLKTSNPRPRLVPNLHHAIQHLDSPLFDSHLVRNPLEAILAFDLPHVDNEGFTWEEKERGRMSKDNRGM